jgi:hypothetical protein
MDIPVSSGKIHVYVRYSFNNPLRCKQHGMVTTGHFR